MTWGVYAFPWGQAVKNEETGAWETLILSNAGAIVEVDVTGRDVILHTNGIEFPIPYEGGLPQ